MKWYNLPYSIRSFLNGLSRWFSYFKVLTKVYDFDYSSILEVEKYQITRVRDAIVKYHNHLDWERDVELMDLALKLLSIIEEGGCSERVGKDITFEPIGDNLSELISDAYYTIPVYVNTKNSKRFSKREQEDYDDPKLGNLWKDDLRQEKAWYLYNKLRLLYLKTWWD